MRKAYAIALAITTLSLAQNTLAQDFDTASLSRHVYILAHDSMQGRGFGTRGGRAAANYIERQLCEAGVEPWGGRYQHPFYSRVSQANLEGANVAGVIWPSRNDTINEFIVLGAHYDHLGYFRQDGDTLVYNGADDNASGTSVTLELGRWLARNRDRLRRPVIVAFFDGEEHGLLGSTQMVRSGALAGVPMSAMFSLDMVGMLAKHGGLRLDGHGSLGDAAGMVRATAERRGIVIKPKPPVMLGDTDTRPFAKAGVPAAHVFTGTVSPYHKPEDDAPLLDYRGMATIAKFMAEIVVELSNLPAESTSRTIASQKAGKEADIAPKQAITSKERYLSAGWMLSGVGAGTVYPDTFYDGKPGTAAAGGLWGRLRIARRLDLQAEALYQYRNGSHALGKFHMHALHVPVELRFKLLAPHYGDFAFYVSGGADYTYRFAGTAGGAAMDFAQAFQREGWGWHYSLGVDIDRVWLAFRETFGVTSMSRTENIQPQTRNLVLGIRF